MRAIDLSDFLNSQSLASLLPKAAILERIILEAKSDGDGRWREPAKQLRIIRAAIEQKTKAASNAPKATGTIVTPVTRPSGAPPITVQMDPLSLSVRTVRMGQGT